MYWFDPVDVAMGRLSQLALPSSKKFEAVGVILLAVLLSNLVRTLGDNAADLVLDLLG